ncbi:MAG UNVERIFIED_CONTAM: hypothetical protein LVR29_32350 [Microcystis novacekii LVE1205-3]
MCDTSCATALASYMTAMILFFGHPKYWPGTIWLLESFIQPNGL